ncbi:hypothetical protein [Mycolicibacter kumamotonensis]|jgi:hypothetical protein|uniref:Uncharacterized protein n=1 Tax=Mycolicibacter kumamotonensis TaxID=354243 RepID=A0A1B8SE37_9MYCO|nr:hypothetical protein [Mycolicibacter kumamotonensis]OBY30936.1 hypothetical protein ACT18_15190 [Mycolicibacter kumamotonensis]
MEATTRSTTSRKSLPLTPRDLRDLTAMRESPVHRAVLAELANTSLSETSSEAAVLHAIWEAGVQAVRERVEETGYAQMAADREPAAERKAVARRRRPPRADES